MITVVNARWLQEEDGREKPSIRFKATDDDDADDAAGGAARGGSRTMIAKEEIGLAMKIQHQDRWQDDESIFLATGERY